jgi:hypothetical protein
MQGNNTYESADSWADREVRALKLIFQGDTLYYSPTVKQLSGLNSLLGQVIVVEKADKPESYTGTLTNYRRDIRLNMLRLITGIEKLESSSDLTLHTVSAIIDYVKGRAEEDWTLNEQGRKLFRIIAERAQEQVDGRSGTVHPTGMAADLPDVWETGEVSRYARIDLDPW